MSITVSMPVHEADGRLLRLAVLSVLNQTHSDLRLVVVADGDPTELDPLADINDSRLIRHTLLDRRGRYFIDALVVAVCDTEFWTPHDADDWSEPDRYEELAVLNTDVVWSSYWHHPVNGAPFVRHPTPVPGVLRYFAHHNAGLYRTSAVRAVGGPHPQFKGSGDTLMMCLLETMFGSTVVDSPKFHHVKRADSLSKHPDTGLGSEWRKGQQRLQRRVWAKKANQPYSKWVTHPNVADETRRALDRETERLTAVWEV